MKKIPLVLFLSVASFVVPHELKAQGYAAAVKVGTQGVSLQAYRALSSYFNVSLGASILSYNANNVEHTSDYKVDGDLKLSNISALADWFPFASSFRLTGGLVVNLNKVSAVITPTVTKVTGNIQYTPDKLGNVTADITFKKPAPYLGLGFGNPTSGSPGLGFTFDLGAFYHGKPQATMTGTKLLTPMESQGPQLQSNLSWFQFYPVLSFGISYKF